MTNLNSNTDAFRPPTIVTTNSLFTRPLEDDVIRVEQRHDDVSDWDAGSILCIVGPFIALFVIIIIISLINLRLSKNKSSIYPHIKMKTTDMTSYEMYKPTKDQSKIELYSPPSQRNVVITVELKESHRKSILKTKKISSTSDIKNNDNERILVKTSKSAPTLVGTPLPSDGIPASFSTLKQINWKSLDSDVCSCHTESNTSLALSTNSRNSLILPEIKCCHCRLRELHNN